MSSRLQLMTALIAFADCAGGVAARTARLTPSGRAEQGCGSVEAPQRRADLRVEPGENAICARVAPLRGGDGG
jgi:hypothetical protein